MKFDKLILITNIAPSNVQNFCQLCFLVVAVRMLSMWWRPIVVDWGNDGYLCCTVGFSLHCMIVSWGQISQSWI